MLIANFILQRSLPNSFGRKGIPYTVIDVAWCALAGYLMLYATERPAK